MKRNYFFTIIIAALVSTQACKKSNPDPENKTGKTNYAISVAGGAAGATTYLFGTSEFPSGTLGTANAKELTGRGSAFKYGKHFYQTTFGAPATLRKYSFDDSGTPIEEGAFAIPGYNTFGAVDFLSENEGYALVNSFGVTPLLIKFNPSEMKITGTIDLSSVQKAGVGATESYYQGMIHRDNYLFIGVNYQKNFQHLDHKVNIVIIDKTTGLVVKQISDDRGSQMWNGGTEASFTPNFMIKDTNGDIYAMGYAAGGKSSGILRIKNGEINFDPTYYFDLNAATGGPCLGLFHFGSGQTFTVKYTVNSAYPFDTGSPAGQYYKIDLANKTTSGNISSALPLVKGGNTFMTKWDNERIYFGVAAADANSVYSYKLSDGAVKKEFDLASGACLGFAKLN